MSAFRKLAIAYSILVVLTATWALYVDAHPLHYAQEHLLPSTALLFITLPASLSVGTMYEAWPTFFSRTFTQIAWITMCGVGQAAVLFLVAGLVRRRMPG